jgi:hypothetical protein
MLVRDPRSDAMDLMLLIIAGLSSAKKINPSRSLSFLSFDQIAFNKYVNEVMAEEVLDLRGTCFGYLTTSFAYSCVGQEEIFDHEIQDIHEAKEFNESQINLINTLKNSQSANKEKEMAVQIDDNTLVIITEILAEKKTDVHCDNRYENELKQSVEAAIDMTITYFGNKIGLILTNGLISHVIGLVAKQHEEKIVLRYDDPNYFIKVAFDNFEDAVSDITKLLCFGYYGFYYRGFVEKQIGSVWLAHYHAECNDNEVHSSTPALCEWAKSKRDTFFAPQKAILETEVIFSEENENKREYVN